MKNHLIGMMEQGMVSFFNFLIILVYSREMTSYDFALFVIIHSTVTLSFLITNIFFAMPIQIYLETKYNSQFIKYIQLVMKQYLVTSYVLSSVFLILMHIFVREVDWYTYLFSLIFSILWGLYEIIRKICYAQQKTKTILIGSFLLVGMFITYSLFLVKEVSLLYSFVILCISYSCAILTSLLFRGNMRQSRGVRVSHFSFQKDVLHTHWNVSKWPMIGMVFYWLSTQGYMIFLSYFISDVQLGAFRTAMNLLGLITILLVLFENMYTPIASQEYFNKGIRGLYLLVVGIYKKASLPLLGITFIATVISYFLYAPIFGEKYASFSYLTILFGVYQLFQGIYRPALVGLVAMEKTKPIFIGNLLNATVTIIVGLTMTQYLHVIGSVMGFVVATILLSIYTITSFKKTKKAIERSEAA